VPCLAEIELGDWGWQVEEKGEERSRRKKERRKKNRRKELSIFLKL
jgi:hypothetical protein